MSSFPAAISHCLRGLLHFGGRDTRSQFWFYVLGLVLAEQVLSVMIMIPLFFGVFRHFGRGDVAAPTVFPDFRMFAAIGIATVLFGLFLLAAAVTRRLHDRGMAGWWGMMPVPFALFGMVAFFSFASEMGQGNGAQPDDRLFAMMFINNAVYMLTIIGLIVLLVKASDPGSNRYGPSPDL